MRRYTVAPLVLATASLACFALPGVSRSPVARLRRPAAQPAAARSAAPLPEEVFPQGSAVAQPGMPQVVLAGDPQPVSANLPVTEYGNSAGAHVIEVASFSGVPSGVSPHPETAMPQTVLGGEETSAAVGLPETILGAGAGHTQPSSGPVTVYAGATDTTPREDATTQIAANPNGYGVETITGHSAPPQLTASPYTHLTDAQRVGINPCERRHPGPSPYSNQTDAQRASQTNCR